MKKNKILWISVLVFACLCVISILVYTFIIKDKKSSSETDGAIISSNTASLQSNTSTKTKKELDVNQKEKDTKSESSESSIDSEDLYNETSNDDDEQQESTPDNQNNNNSVNYNQEEGLATDSDETEDDNVITMQEIETKTDKSSSINVGTDSIDIMKN